MSKPVKSILIQRQISTNGKITGNKPAEIHVFLPFLQILPLIQKFQTDLQITLSFFEEFSAEGFLPMLFYTCQILWQEEALQHVTNSWPHGWPAGRLASSGWSSDSLVVLKIEAQQACQSRATLTKSYISLLPLLSSMMFILTFLFILLVKYIV